MKQAGAALLLCAALIACAHNDGTKFVPTDVPNRASLAGEPGRYKQLFIFDGADGADPSAQLLESNGVLYGTTPIGGNYSVGGGTVFSLTRNGKENVLHDFGAAGDGRGPQSAVLWYDGSFYGTTEYGGKYSDGGTVFSLTPAGKERVLHSFGKAPDGKNPIGRLIELNGVLYGTTSAGGRHNSGVVFRMTTDGSERVIYSFGRTQGDGRDPEAGLISLNGRLYGTTFSGGCDGTVFSITTSGKESILHRFGCGSSGDGAGPNGDLLADGDMLYGVTFGGGYGKQSQIFGTVYSVTTDGHEKVLHSFGAGNDGRYPEGSLVLVGNTLYGVTVYGGKGGYGTIFSITKSGAESVRYGFAAPPDGSNPSAALTKVKAELYGTTPNGGGGYHAHGTVFQISL